MNPILIPIDGSAPSLNALKTAIQFNKVDEHKPLFLVTVMPPLVGRSRGLFTFEQLNSFYEAESDLMLKDAKALLAQYQISFQERMVVGAPAEMIAAVAQQINAHKIYIGTRGRGAARSLLLGSVAAKLVTLSSLPITLVNSKE